MRSLKLLYENNDKVGRLKEIDVENSQEEIEEQESCDYLTGVQMQKMLE